MTNALIEAKRLLDDELAKAEATTLERWRKHVRENDLNRVRLKGGSGSGHHGHQGRPGKRGGSLPGRVNTKLDFFLGREVDYNPGSHVVSMYEEVIDQVSNMTGEDYQGVHFLLNRRVMGDVLGTRTTIKRGEKKGQVAVVLSPEAIESAVSKNGDYLLRWFNIDESSATFDNVFRHVAAHELGHLYYKKLPVATKARITDFVTSNWKLASEQSRTYKIVEEAYVDFFAGYTLGYSLPISVEDLVTDTLE